MSLGCLKTLPRAGLAGPPTPLERLDNLTRANGGATLWAKRDDTHPLAFGGNKVRQLDYYFGEAIAEGADTVLITGAVQSNFCRLAAAFAAKLGMECHIQQEERVAKTDPAYRTSGNVLISKLLGAHLHPFPAGEDEAGADAALGALAEKLRAEGRVPYIVHLAPGHPPLGALGYIHCAREIIDQAAEAGVAFDQVAVGSGSGATHAGLLYGLRALGSDMPVMGICVRRPAAAQIPRIEKRCAEIAALLGAENPVAAGDIQVNERFLAPGYGLLNAPTARAIRLAGRTEALALDPVYTGKVMAGALNLAGTLPEGRNVLFVHTGGTPAVFAYAGAVEEAVG